MTQPYSSTFYALSAIAQSQIIKYTGDGTASRKISLSFQPKLIILYDPASNGSALLIADFDNSRYQENGIGGASSHLDDTVQPFLSVFPTKTTLDVGFLFNNELGVSVQWNALNNTYELIVYG